MGDELYYINKKGERKDAELHEEILNNPEAEAISKRISIKRSIERGTSPEVAKMLYGDY